MFDYSRLRNTELKYLVSLAMSYFLLILMGFDLLRGFNLLRNHNFQLKTSKENEEKEPRMTESDKQLFEKYSETINMTVSGNHRYFSLVDSLRFSAIQLAIVSLQLLNRTQALIILIVDILFFCYFVALACRVDIFKKDYMMDKTVIQECCILIFLVAVTLFSFTEDSEFSSSTTYTVIEIAAVVSIIVAAGFELGMGIFATYAQFSRFLRRSKRRKSKKIHPYKKVYVSRREEERGRNQGEEEGRGGQEDSNALETLKLTSQRQRSVMSRFSEEEKLAEGREGFDFGGTEKNHLSQNPHRPKRFMNSQLSFRGIRIKNRPRRTLKGRSALTFGRNGKI